MKDELHRVDRIDVVWDSYKTQTIKEATRLKRGTGVRRKVAASTKIPKEWIDFLRNSENKKELFLFLSSQILDYGIRVSPKHSICQKVKVLCQTIGW